MTSHSRSGSQTLSLLIQQNGPLVLLVLIQLLIFIGLVATAMGMEDPTLTPIFEMIREYHVSPQGDDKGLGSSEHPFRTFGRAAEAAMPGDSVIVHPGLYRERVNPPRGGTSENARITYRAAPGGPVMITGSEAVVHWEKQADGTWKAVGENVIFGNYNPFALNVKAAWQRYGDWHTRGAVYWNGKARHEVRTREEVAARPLSWKADVRDGKTTIHAHFGESDPTQAIIEINARETVFFPETPRLAYITVSGFTLRHAAPNCAPPGTLQKGAIGPNLDHRELYNHQFTGDR